MAAPSNTPTEQIQPTDEQQNSEEQPFEIPDILEKPVTDERIIRHFSSNIKTGSILDIHGFLQHVLDKEFGAKIVQCLKDAGLYNYVTFAHQHHHLVDATEFYLNAKVPEIAKDQYLDEINSHVQGIDISFVPSDIQTVFRFPERDNSYASSCDSHGYEKREMWELIKTSTQPESVPFPIKKKMLKLDYEFTVDILNKMVENKVSGTDDISDEKLRMLSALLNNFKVDWSKVVFEFLKRSVISGVCKTTGKINKVLGFGFVIAELLKSKGITLREGVPVHRSHFHMRQKPQKYDRRKAIEMGIAVPSPPKKTQKKRKSAKEPEPSKKKKSTKEPEPSRKRKATGKLPRPKKKKSSTRDVEREAESTVPPVEAEPINPAVDESHPSPVQSTQVPESSEDELTLAQLAEQVRQRKDAEPTIVQPSVPLKRLPGLPADCSWTSSSSEETSEEESATEGEVNMTVRSIHDTDHIDSQHPSSPVEHLAQPEELTREAEIEHTDEDMQTGDEAEASVETVVLPTSPIDEAAVSGDTEVLPSSPIDADSELARQMAQEEFDEYEAEQSTEDILRVELRRVLAWQKWRMSSLPVIAETLTSMWDEETWALNWMGTTSIFAATRPDEIDRVFQDKLAGRDKGKGKGRAVDDVDPAEQARADKRLLRRVQLLSKFQEQFVDRTPGVGPSHAAEEASSHADDSTHQRDEASPEWQMVVFQEPLTTTPLDREDPHILQEESRTVPTAPPRQASSSPSLARDENREASRGASHEGSEPVTQPEDSRPSPNNTPDENREASTSACFDEAPQSLALIPVCPRPSSSPARDGNQEASRGADHDNSRPRTAQPEATSSTSQKPAQTSRQILAALETLADEQRRHFKTLRRSIHRVKKKSRRATTTTATPPRNTNFEAEMLQAQANNEQMFTRLIESISDLYSNQEDIRKTSLGLQEQVGLSCVKVDLLTENVNTSGENVLDCIWEVNELKLMVDRLTKTVTSALSTNDANKGEESCRLQGQGRSHDGRDDDEEEGGRRRKRQSARVNIDNIPLALLSSPRPSSSPRDDTQRKSSTTRQQTTLTAEGRSVVYEPYVRGSGKRFQGCNIPPYLKNKSNLFRQDYQRRRNEEIDEEIKQQKIIEAEALKRQQLKLDFFASLKEEVAVLENVNRTSSQQIKLHAILRILKKTGQSFSDGRYAAELLCWWDRRIIEGRNVLEATENYLRFNISGKYKDLAENRSIRDARKIINDEIDRNDLVEREKQAMQRK